MERRYRRSGRVEILEAWHQKKHPDEEVETHNAIGMDEYVELQAAAVKEKEGTPELTGDEEVYLKDLGQVPLREVETMRRTGTVTESCPPSYGMEATLTGGRSWQGWTGSATLKLLDAWVNPKETVMSCHSMYTSNGTNTLARKEEHVFMDRLPIRKRCDNCVQ